MEESLRDRNYHIDMSKYGEYGQPTSHVVLRKYKDVVCHNEELQKQFATDVHSILIDMKINIFDRLRLVHWLLEEQFDNLDLSENVDDV